MLEFLSLKPEAFGLDISDLSLKIIRLGKKREGFSLDSFGETEIKPGIIKGGEIKDEDGLAKIIQKAIAEIKGKKLNTKYVIVSLPEEKGFLQVIQMPKMLEEDLKSAVIFEAENYIPLPIEEVYLDSQIIPSQKDNLDHYDILLAALPKKTVDPYLSSIKKAGLHPLAFEIESLSVARALIKNETTDCPVLLIDMGATKTSFIIFSGSTLRFNSFIPVSSQKFTEVVSRTLKIDLADAEKMKIKYGLETKATKEGGQVFDALIPSLTDLVEQIKKHIEYYQTHTSHEHLPSGDKKVAKVILCGGGANLTGLSDFISKELNLPVELGNPWVNILTGGKKGLQELPPDKSLTFASALGLAIRGIKI